MTGNQQADSYFIFPKELRTSTTRLHMTASPPTCNSEVIFSYFWDGLQKSGTIKFCIA